ncbi:MAG: hypothetical protein ACRC42_00515 [Mycoplasma sp.]
MKSSIAVQLLSFGSIVLTLLFGGVIISIYQFAEVDAIKYISMAWPPSGIMQLFNITVNLANTNDIFDFNSDFILQFSYQDDIHVFYAWTKVFFFVTPLVSIVVLSLLAVKFFKWGSR